MQTAVIFEQVIILAILGAIGVSAARLKIISPAVKESLAGLIVKITTPLMIITSLSEMQINSEIIQNGIWVVLFAYISVFMLLGVGILSKRLMKLPENTGVVHVLHTAFGNIVFLGFPVLNAVFPGGEALLYAALYQVVSNTLMWTLAIWMLSRQKKESISSNLKKLLNPNTIALVIGLVLMGFQLKLPGILQKSLGGLGNTTLYLAMLYIGAIMADINLKKMAGHFHVLVLSINKLITGPLLILFFIELFVYLTGISFGFVAKASVVLETAMPCMAIMVILVKNYGADDETAAENLFLTTVLSLLTLPLVYYILTLFP